MSWVKDSQDFFSANKRETLPSFVEAWIDESGIPAMYWTTATTGTGTAARDMTEAGYAKVLLSCPAGADTSNMYSAQRWKITPALYTTSSIIRKCFLEFTAKTGTLANIDNATTFLGFVNTQGDTRATDNVMGFIFVADVLTSLTDSTSTETTTDVSAGITVTNWNKYKIEIYSGGVKFSINEVLKATHTTNLQDAVKYVNFYVKSEGAVATTLSIGNLRIWYSDEV